MAAKFGVFVDEDHSKLPMLYCLTKLLKRPISHVLLLSNSNSCTTTELSIILTSCLTAIKIHALKYFETDFERNGKTLLYVFWSVKISGEVLNK